MIFREWAQSTNIFEIHIFYQYILRSYVGEHICVHLNYIVFQKLVFCRFSAIVEVMPLQSIYLYYSPFVHILSCG